VAGFAEQVDLVFAHTPTYPDEAPLYKPRRCSPPFLPPQLQMFGFYQSRLPCLSASRPLGHHGHVYVYNTIKLYINLTTMCYPWPTRGALPISTTISAASAVLGPSRVHSHILRLSDDCMASAHGECPDVTDVCHTLY
jgi:hypothetical protein